MPTKKKGVSAGRVAAIGAGAAAVGSAAYYFLGPKGKQHQNTAKRLIAKAEKKVMAGVKKSKALTKTYSNAKKTVNKLKGQAKREVKRLKKG